MNNRNDFLKSKLKNLPNNPGVYIMKDESLKIIYIGKAKNLKNRVSTYFINNKKNDVKVKAMVSYIYDFDYIITDSEFEALLLECSLIKHHKPKYNILLKDDKGYNYIEITNEEYPKIRSVYQKDETSKNEYIGPFLSSFVVKNTVDMINDTFMLPTCNRKFPKDFGKQRPCLNFFIKKCSGVCTGKLKKEDYLNSIDDALKFLRKEDVDLIKYLKEQMNIYSEKLDFEKAALYRDKIQYLSRIQEGQKVILKDKIDADFVGFSFDYKNIVVTILKFRNGFLNDKYECIFYDRSDIEDIKNSFISMYYIDNASFDGKVYLDFDFLDNDILSTAIKSKLNRKIEFLTPIKGDKFKIIMMAIKNSKDKIDLLSNHNKKDNKILSELQHVLKLEKLPMYIESYDISNLGSDDMIGTMVVFKNAKPYKSDYKKFIIKNQNFQNDYLAMSEMIERRFKRYLSNDSSFNKLPDLILLDGGKGHLSTICNVLDKLSISIPIFGMVKNNKHKTEAIVSIDGKIDIKLNSNLFKFITTIQNEVHRFSVEYQRKLMKKRNINLTLTNISGIGEKKAIILLSHFKSIDNLKKSNAVEISNLKGINKRDAENILSYFNN